jgi:uncharacterized protein YdbL (DUF1318 family)
MTQIVSDVNQNQSREFRTVTASTKVTDLELAELEQAAASRGLRLGEWVRDVLLRESRSSDGALEPDPLMTEIVALQMFLTNVLSFVACGDRMSSDQYQELMRSVKASKRRTAREVVAQYASERKEEGHA